MEDSAQGEASGLAALITTPDARHPLRERFFEAPAARGDWMITASGRPFWPFDPRPDEVWIEDIAQGLANLARFQGQLKHFYSVAQHSVELARWFLANGDVTLARWALMHDGAEAYIGDQIRPIKPHIPLLKDVERRIERAVFARFGLGGDLPARVDEADKLICIDEQLAFLPIEAIRFFRLDTRPRLGIEHLRPLDPVHARDAFLKIFRELF